MNLLRDKIIMDLDVIGNVQVDPIDGLLWADFFRIFKLINKYIVRVPLITAKIQERREKLRN